MTRLKTLAILMLCVAACATSSAAPSSPSDGHCPEPQPPSLPVVRIAGPEDGCPEEWVGCLDLEGALALERYLRASQAWMREASARCGR